MSQASTIVGISWLLCAVCASPAMAQAPPVRAAVSGAPVQSGVDALGLASVRRLFHALERERSSRGEGIVAAWTDVSIVMAAVTGVPSGVTLTFEELAAASASGTAVRVPAIAGTPQRDAVADRMLALGYSARETADVLTRRISQQALDTAMQMIAVGGDRQSAARYLDSQYRQMAALNRPKPGVIDVHRNRSGVFDPWIDRYAALHNVEANIVRAIIATESDFNPLARSRAGALGLMQLMPATARELGVNPLVPEQNLEGGIRYFSQLTRMFGTLELALIAYNAGPGFAARYGRGQTGLYGETREYVTRVLRRLQDPPSGPVREARKGR